jgi:hypothetical protein
VDESGTPVTVRASSYEGDRSRLVFESGGFEAVVHGPADVAVARGDRIRVRVDPSLVILLPPD